MLIKSHCWLLCVLLLKFTSIIFIQIEIRKCHFQHYHFGAVYSLGNILRGWLWNYGLYIYGYFVPQNTLSLNYSSQELSHNLSPPLTCSHLKVTIFSLWYLKLLLWKGSKSWTASCSRSARRRRGETERDLLTKAPFSKEHLIKPWLLYPVQEWGEGSNVDGQGKWLVVFSSTV